MLNVYDMGIARAIAAGGTIVHRIIIDQAIAGNFCSEDGKIFYGGIPCVSKERQAVFRNGQSMV